MKHRPAAPPIRYKRDRFFERTVRFTRSVELVERNLGHRDAGRFDLTDSERLQVTVAVLCRRHGLDPDAYGPKLAAAINHLRSPVAAPICDNPVSDLAEAWSQPEARTFWASWAPQIRGHRAPGYEASRAALVATAAVAGPYFRNGWEHVRQGSSLATTLADLATDTGRAGRGATSSVLREYSASTRHLSALSDGAAIGAMAACVEIVRRLAEMFPEYPIGRYLVVDGTDVPAWAQQRSAKRNGVVDDNLEDHLNRRVPYAEFRAYSRDRTGLFDPDFEPSRRPQQTVAKAWRGYMSVVMCEAVTGLPLVGVLEGASLHEPRALYRLLPMLFALWPDAPVEAIIADGRWDEEAVHEFALVRYGIPFIARRSTARLGSAGKLFKPDDPQYRGGIGRVDGSGVAYCRAHDRPLKFEGTEMPSRRTLEPGEPLTQEEADRRARAFRSRWRCEQGCGRVTLPTRLAWSTLPYYPHNPFGRPELHAFRIAALSRRNVAESLFSSMKAGQRNGLRGTSRTRLYDKDVTETLIWLGLLTRSLLVIASARASDGIATSRSGAGGVVC